jgi:hypothetical protein
MTIPDTTATPRLPWDATDPYLFYEQRRRDGDAVWDDTARAWLVLGHNAARQVLGGSGWTSDPLANPNVQAAMQSAFSPDLVSRSMLFADGADHARLRRSVRDVFTPTFISGLTAGIEAIATATINDPPTSSTFNFMADIALALPVVVAAEWLGLDTETAQLLRQQSPVIIRMLGALADPDEITAGAAAFAVLVTELLPLAADRRSYASDDLLSFIAADPNLELDEVVITAILIAVAGHETTANLLGAVMVRLLTPAPTVPAWWMTWTPPTLGWPPNFYGWTGRYGQPRVSRPASSWLATSKLTPASRLSWSSPPPTATQPSSIAQTNSDCTAADRHRCPLDLGRTTALAHHSPDWKPPSRYAESSHARPDSLAWSLGVTLPQSGARWMSPPFSTRSRPLARLRHHRSLKTSVDKLGPGIGRGG